MSKFIERLIVFNSVSSSSRDIEHLKVLSGECGLCLEELDNVQMALEKIEGDNIDAILVFGSEPNLIEMFTQVRGNKLGRYVPVMIIVEDGSLSVLQEIEMQSKFHPYDFIFKGFSSYEFNMRLQILISNSHAIKAKVKLQRDIDKIKSSYGYNSNRDCLTGVYNRLSAMKIIRDYIEKSNYDNVEFSMIICDIDYFKNINDSYGREFGDFVLKGVAGLMKKAMDDSNYIARWYGETFIAAIPNVGLDGAVEISQNIKRVIESTPIKLSGVQLSVTATFGAVALRDGDDADSMIDRLESKLCEGKKICRSRIYY